jgi:hypothetical protein
MYTHVRVRTGAVSHTYAFVAHHAHTHAGTDTFIHCVRTYVCVRVCVCLFLSLSLCVWVPVCRPCRTLWSPCTHRATVSSSATCKNRYTSSSTSPKTTRHVPNSLCVHMCMHMC